MRISKDSYLKKNQRIEGRKDALRKRDDGLLYPGED